MIEASPKRNILFQYLWWHFVEIPKGILKGCKNFLIFNLHYFSIGFLLRTLFAHWRKYKDSYGRGFDVERYLRVFVSNMVSRIFGFLVRSFTIFCGLVTEAFILLGAILVFFGWLFLPILLILGFWYGFQLII